MENFEIGATGSRANSLSPDREIKGQYDVNHIPPSLRNDPRACRSTLTPRSQPRTTNVAKRAFRDPCRSTYDHPPGRWYTPRGPPPEPSGRLGVFGVDAAPGADVSAYCAAIDVQALAKGLHDPLLRRSDLFPPNFNLVEKTSQRIEFGRQHVRLGWERCRFFRCNQPRWLNDRCPR